MTGRYQHRSTQISCNNKALAVAAHMTHPNWKPRGTTEKQQPAPGDGKPRF